MHIKLTYIFWPDYPILISLPSGFATVQHMNMTPQLKFLALWVSHLLSKLTIISMSVTNLANKGTHVAKYNYTLNHPLPIGTYIFSFSLFHVW